MNIKLCIEVAILLLLAGCASATKGMTPDEKEYYFANRDTVDRSNWSNCQQVYSKIGQPTIHKGHMHGGIHKNLKTTLRTRYETREDLTNNQCKMMIADEYWETY